jgi:hypothetical protein
MNTLQEYERIKETRGELVSALRLRDGNLCQYPGHEHPLDFTVKDGPTEVTIDHWFPQWYGKSEGWTYEQIWDLSNLKLMCKKHNAKKGDLIPNEDGTLPEKPKSTFRFRRQKRATRVGMCEICQNGHLLYENEICASCGGNGQAYPRTHFAKFQDCDHEIMWCQWCSIGDVPRKNSIAIAMRQADSDELGEYILED